MKWPIRLRSIWLALMISCVVICHAAAQNFKYSTNQFGVEGSLLGGAVVSGIDDMSMTYYNPAAIHNVTSLAEISLLRPSIGVFGYRQFWENNQDNKLSWTFDLAPLQVAVRTKIKDVDLVFLKINKATFTDKFSSIQEFSREGFVDSEAFEYQYDGISNWYGVGTSFQLRSNLHIGFSQFVDDLRLFYRYNILDRSTMTGMSGNELQRYFSADTRRKFSQIGFISKMGIIYFSGRHHFGFTVTTPTWARIPVKGNFGVARIQYDADYTSIDQITDQEVIPRIKTPWHFNFGYSIKFSDGNALWFDASYYSAIDDYEMALVESATDNRQWMNGNKEVINFGIGYSGKLRKNFEILGGVRTNRFAFQNKKASGSNVRNVILDGDAIHFSTGTKIRANKHTILLGIDWGRLITTPNEADPLFADLNRLNINHSSLTKNTINILFTYGFILDEFKKKKP